MANSVIDLKSFRFTRYTLRNLKEKDWLINLVDYLDGETASNKYAFFYDLLPNLRFLKPKNGVVAYTDRASQIFMNAPGEFGKDEEIWKFIYMHECLHQLWETFDVENEIKNAGIKLDHYTLNIASDCIINAFLRDTLGLKAPNDGIFPEVLKNDFRVEYIPEEDTQFTLYQKLQQKLEEEQQEDEDEYDELIKKLEELAKKLTEEEDNKGSHSDDMGTGDNEPDDDFWDDIDDDDSDLDADDEPDDNLSDDGTDSDSADDNDGSDSNSSKDNQDLPNDILGKDGEGANGQGGDLNKSNHDKTNSNSRTSIGNNIRHEAVSAAQKRTEKALKKAKQTLTSPIGDFVKKCKMSKLLKETTAKQVKGLNLKTDNKGDNSWNKAMNINADMFIKKQVSKLKREYQKTYMRPKRGTTPKVGQIVMPGRRKRNNKINVSVSFFVDVSGSMDHVINEVLECVWKMSDDLSGKYDKVYSETDFKYFAFNTYLKEIKYKDNVAAWGGTMSFESLFRKIKENAETSMVNVIITDAEMDCNQTKILEQLNSTETLFIFVTNMENKDFIEIANKVKNKNFIYIQADEYFNTD